MRIGIDLQGVQSEGSRSRGIGRYSLEIIRHLIKESPRDYFVLIANASLSNLESLFKSELVQNNVSYFEWSSPCPFDYLSNNPNLYELALYIKSYSCSCLHLDVVIITSFLEGFSENSLIEYDRDLIDVKILSIFYDLIPLLNPHFYFKDNLEFEKFYRNKLNKLKKVDGLMAISDSAAKEASEYLEFDTNFVFNISSACDRDIFNTTRSITASNLIIPILESPFLLYAGAGDTRKNLKGLLEAYSLLPLELKHFKLVLAGKLYQLEKELIDTWIKDFSIDPTKVVKTGYISDDDLVILYRSCYLFIFPSFHEGFGLPVLEAMSCGAPVIGSEVTSIPEVIQNSEAMFDPADTNSIKQLILKVLKNSEFRDKLVVNSKSQCKRFSWSNTAKAISQACVKVTAGNYKKLSDNSYQIISQNNKKNLDKLFLKISKIKFSNKSSKDQVWKMIASSIDIILQQLDLQCRNISFNLPIKSWEVQGPFDSSYSLAKLNRHFVEALDKKISNLSILNTEGFGDYKANIDYLKRFSLIYSLYSESKIKSYDIDVVSRNLYPPRVKDMNARVNILHSYGWEESGFPAEWVADFNTYLQGMTVMSYQVKKILIDNGVKIPIKVAGLGLNHIDHIDQDNSFNVPAKKYKLLHISSCFPRKGIDVLLQAYCDTFTDQDDVSLIIKTFSNPHNDVENSVDQIRRNNSTAPDIILLTQDMTDEQIKSLVIQSDVLVAPSRGEGFGLPIGEAMRLGVPVITTAWGGQLDFCNNDNAWLIDYEFVFSNSHFNIGQSYWAEPSRKHLSQLLYEVYTLDQSIIDKKINAAKESTNKFTWDNVAQNNLDFVNNKCLNHKFNFFKLGIVTTWNSRCGIASYSKNLFSGISEDVVIFSPYEEDYNPTNADKVIPKWFLDNEKQDFCELYETIIKEDITTVFIQFNYGLFCFNKLSKLVDDLVNRNINVVMLLHSTKDPDDVAKRIHSLTKCLLNCHRVFIHTIQDLNRLKDLGITNNVHLLPHGITDLIPETNSIKFFKNKFKTGYKKNIASYGFCLPNKGYKELIRSIGLLKETGFEVSLTIFSAIYSEYYLDFYEELKELIKDLNLEESISIITDYMSDEDTLKELCLFDCLVFPYQISNESSSAAVRQGIASLRPVLVPRLDIFEDVSDLVDFFPGNTPNDIAMGIKNWYVSNKIRLHNTDYDFRKKLLKNRRFNFVRRKLFDTLRSLQNN